MAVAVMKVLIKKAVSYCISLFSLKIVEESREESPLTLAAIIKVHGQRASVRRRDVPSKDVV